MNESAANMSEHEAAQAWARDPFWAQKQALAERVDLWRTERKMDNETARALAQGLRELTDENEHLRRRAARLEAALEQIAAGLSDVDGEPFYPDEYARRVLDQERPATIASTG